MNKFLFFVERYGPLLFGAMIFIAALWYKSDLQQLSQEKTISVAGLYSAVFGWASIQTGFLFSVYGFIATKNDGFLAEIRGTGAMLLVKRYTLRAMLMGFLLTIITIPLIVIGEQIVFQAQFYLSALWFAIFAWAFAAFLRVALNFGQIISVKDKVTIPG
ncbi:hypothetical protein DXT90_00110 [Agrobacterium tumefaciens]|nr:hypothetical protein [Agrobacterium tumefaciens]